MDCSEWSATERRRSDPVDGLVLDASPVATAPSRNEAGATGVLGIDGLRKRVRAGRTATAGQGVPVVVEPALGGRVPRWPHGVVADVADRIPRSRYVVHLLSYSVAVRTRAPGAPRGARRARRRGAGTADARQRREARADVEGRGAVLPRPDARSAEDQRVARHRSDPERPAPRRPRRGE